MEPKFKITTVMSKSLLYHFFFNVLFGKLYLICAAIVALCGALLAIIGDNTDMVFYIVFPIVLIIFAFLLPKLQANQTYAANKIKYSGKEPATVEYSFFDDKAKSYEGAIDLTTDYFYSDFVKLKKTNKLFLIKFKHNIYLIMDKSNFTVGTPEEFEAFIKDKIKK